MSNHDEPVPAPETKADEPAPRPAPRLTPAGKLRGPILGLLLAVGLGGLAGGIYFYLQREPAPVVKTEAPPVKDVYYCPMHPQYKSDKPADCPICSMKLVKMETGAGHTEMPGMEGGSGTPAAQTIFIDPQRQQLIGVQSVPVISQPLEKVALPEFEWVR